MSENEREVFKLLQNKYPTIKRKLFKKTLNKAIDKATPLVEMFENITMPLVPDGYVINETDNICTVFEIENQNRLSEIKLDKYGYLWFDLDYYYWDLKLMIVNRFGHISEYSLPERYLGATSRAVQNKQQKENKMHKTGKAIDFRSKGMEMLFDEIVEECDIKNTHPHPTGRVYKWIKDFVERFSKVETDFTEGDLVVMFEQAIEMYADEVSVKA